ncbi:Aminopeptidase N [Zhongshania aliphaticivorans]|uniref:Aminopeptidase N n=1 Tax=Zhongshania aliphaticivorans TaxID=1470434 RepID=A0A5S9NBF4_9GAMM|nr:aminopeptidase N [Zhongshania aliphaticivorans]CAA0087141.1 Aminopeptidase N [Zhongshania aliphaticivorans]CAA0114132.1 Aminopeptidase N [Zhongshania aliphaticivorans]
MRDAQPSTIFLSDYRVPDFLIDSTHLQFELGEDSTSVCSVLAMRRNPDAAEQGAPLKLHGTELELISLAIDGRQLSDAEWSQSGEELIIDNVPSSFSLSCETRLRPQENTSLEGLYKSSGMFCTQCEAEGFRKITYYLDRPDVMSVFTVEIIADKERYPVLLSNGNLMSSEEQASGKSKTVWHDPFPKPAYLFALVAGKLAVVDDQFVTMNGRCVDLKIYVEEKDLDKCDHAMLSLKNAMRWDEEVYGREYDLDIFNIVAVDDFNMGAMENKSLNIFNTSCVLAKPETTTDAGFQRVEGVVAHEYFHNWSGNRVTCRDWFQLSLKEGFTVFRDAAFSSDMGSPTVKRVEDVTLLRTAQFAEDAGPMAHPIRPDSFIEISNFYTVTIYEKGAEVVRMIHTLLGPELFRKGSDLYFDRHDGQAVTCEDFVLAMEDASGIDLQQFRNWYSQAGTPQLMVSGVYDEQTKTYTLSVKQSCPATPGQPQKAPYHIPLAVALIGEAGQLPLNLDGVEADIETADNTERVLNVSLAEQDFVFKDVEEEPVPSLLRGFSAPVKLVFDYSRAQLLRLMRNDSDGFCRWDASQHLGLLEIKSAIATQAALLEPEYIDVCRDILADTSLDAAMVALMLQLPSEAYLAEIIHPVDVHGIHLARESVRKALANALKDELMACYSRCQSNEEYAATAEQIARRSLKNTALSFLMLLQEDRFTQLAVSQFDTSSNMTDRLAALSCLVNSDAEYKAEALQLFYQQWQHEPLVINQWFQVQAMCHLPGTLKTVKELMSHPAFDIRNPNKVRALIGAFCGQNGVNFHSEDGAAYRFLADQVLLLNRSNPQIASRLLVPLTKWRKYLPAAQKLMYAELERILSEPELSSDVYEVVSKSLQDYEAA